MGQEGFLEEVGLELVQENKAQMKKPFHMERTTGQPSGAGREPAWASAVESLVQWAPRLLAGPESHREEVREEWRSSKGAELGVAG